MPTARRPRFHGPGRHPSDAAIVGLAVPALAALAADPLYSLVDTALIGNLGTRQLGAVAIGGAAFTASFWLFSFLIYGVTARVARALGAGDRDSAASIGVHALAMATAIGLLVAALGWLLAGPVVRALGAGPAVAGFAESYLRIRVLSAPAVLIANVGHGWLRGAQNTRTPMYIATAGAAANGVLDYLLIYPLGFGVQGAAWATVIGQTGAAAAFLIVLRPRLEGGGRGFNAAVVRSLVKIGGDLVVRTGALLGAMTLATAVAARMGIVALASWQIAQQVLLLLALTIDSIAIAGQALIGLHLGGQSPDEARDVGRRLLEWGVLLGVALAVVLLALRTPIARIFSDDPQVIAASASLLGWVAVMQPISALAFTFDGVLIGASDTRFLAGAMAASSALYAMVALASLELSWGTAGLAAGATLWLVARTVTTAARWRGGRWALQA
jgi:MATE family multidrug resistance protein